MPLAGIRVFVVEDEALVLLSLLDMLEDMGCTVPASAQGIADALRKASNLSFDIGLLDVSVAGQRVDPVADLLAGRDIPFVFTSGHERDSLPMRFKERPLLSKPYVASQLQVALLRGLTSSSSGPRASGSLMIMSEPEARGPKEHESNAAGARAADLRRAGNARRPS